GSRTQSIADHFQQSGQVLERRSSDPSLLQTMAAIAETMIETLQRSGKILVAGNGGSAADAQHLARESLSRLNCGRNRLRASALAPPFVQQGPIVADHAICGLVERQLFEARMG